MNDQWTNRLSEYVDGEMDRENAEVLEAHLAECAECQVVLAELRAVAATAAALEDREPSLDLWPGIADRIRKAHTDEHTTVRPIGSARSRRQVAFSVPQLLAAAITFMVVGGGAVAIGLTRQNTEADATLVAVGSSDPSVVPVGLQVGGAEYDIAVEELRHALEEHRSQLDTSTIRVLEENLAVIDQAILEALEALADDPIDQFLNAHLADAKRRKVDLLNLAVALATAES